MGIKPNLKTKKSFPNEQSICSCNDTPDGWNQCYRPLKLRRRMLM